MTTAEVAAAFIAALNSHDPDRIAAMVSEDFFNEHTSSLGSSLRGRSAYRARLPNFLGMFDGLHYDIEDTIADGERAAVPYTLTAQCTGSDGVVRPIRIRGMFRFRVAGDLVTHRVDYWDAASFTAQVEPR